MCDNIIIEERGIIIGIIHYISEYFIKIYNKRIVISDDRIRKIIRYLFYDLKIRKKIKKRTDFVINIKNNIDEKNNNQLIINNLNNLPDNINTTKYFFLLWSNKDNPLIMYKINKKYTKNRNDVKNKFLEFYKSLNCEIFKWNIFVDNNIINNYLELYSGMGNMMDISNMIACYVNNFMNCTKEVITVPYIVKYPVEKENIKYVPMANPIENEKCNENTVIKKVDKELNGLIDNMHNKLKILNNIIIK